MRMVFYMSEKEIKEKTRGWLLPDLKGGKPPAGLYVVATPIGNMGDVSLRALDVLSGVDGVLCEDTRVSGKLLKYFGIEKPLGVYNDHSKDQDRAKIVARVQSGEALALISDAGMPLVSDPGYKLVAAIQDAGLNVTSVPGANAPLAALQLSGMPSDAFSFIGFLPSKSVARVKHLKAWAHVPGTLIAFETAPRLEAALADIEAALGAREVAVVREITKMYEEVRRDDVAALVAHYKEAGAPKGEIVLVIGPGDVREYSDKEIEGMLKEALASMGTKAAAEHVAAATGRTKKDLYNMALKVGKG